MGVKHFRRRIMLIIENGNSSCGRYKRIKRSISSSILINSGGKTSVAPLSSFGKEIIIDSSDE